ncbi:PAS domain S-box protein [Ilyomonas limi]|uniref:histidine kinase n=1 Tax=Ilyomonas limi TaxID=2575867 RepID=A0A4U3L4Q3_9BACT|nr:PAS domain S-box protein [Ilyomonas limi]TKK69922.1 PAS domain S-box protein [Ilyomonas limi]
MFMEGDVLYDNEDAGKMFRSFNLISQHFENQESDLHQHLFTKLPVAILVLKGDHYIIDATNDVNLAIWGKGPEVIGKPLLEIMPDFSEPNHLHILNDVYKKGQSFYFKELPITLTREGKLTTSYYTVEYQPLRDVDDNITGIVVAGFDVTSHVVDRQQLAKSEQKFKDMITHAPVSIAIYKGRNAVFEFVNEDYLKRVDKRYDELIGKPFFEVLPEFAGQGLEEIFEEVFTTGEPYYAKAFSASFTRYGKKANYYSNFVYYPIRNANKEVDGIMVILNDISDLVQSAKATEESEQRFRNLVMQSPVAMGFFKGQDLIVDMVNEAMLKMWQRTDAEVMGRRLVDIFPELKDQPFPALLNQVYETGKIYKDDEAITYVRTPTGELQEKYMQLQYLPLQGAYKQTTGILITINDITAQVRARKQVEENEQYFRKMADNVPVIIFLWKSDGYSIYKNRQWYEYTGASEEEAQGFSWLNYVDINSRPEVQQTLFNAIKNKTSLKVEFQLRRKDGKYRWFEKAVTPRFDNNGQIEGYIGTMSDIHERKLAEEQLKDAEERLRLAAEATGMATFDMDMQTYNIIYSPRLLEIFGYANTEDQNVMPRSKLFERIHPDDLAIAENAMNRAYQNGSYTYEARIIWADKSIHWIKVEGKIFYSPSNKPMRMIGMVEDITRRKQLEQHKDDFMGIVSHELKTPVTTLKVYTQLLQEQFKSVSDAIPGNMVHRMDSQINKLRLLIKDLLDTARIDTGTLQLDYQLFDLNKILNDVVEELSVTNHTHRIIKQSSQSFMIVGDAARTSQVVFNLISNAIKYSPNAQEVIINAQQKEKFVWCSIQDFGVGIIPDNLPNLFDKYFRINNKILGTYPGLGLGLFISAQIIRLQGGDIWAESEEGKGSTFWFSLPLANIHNE